MNALARAAVAAVLLALVGGCDAKPPEPAPPPTAQSQSDVPPPLVPAMPLPENAVDNAVAKLDGIADDLMKKSGIPGLAVAVVHGGKTVYAKGFGVRDVKTGDKVDPDTVFQLASLSKPLSATVVADQVRGTGAIGWDTPIVAELPGSALSDPAVTQMVTVGDMLSHRTGLPDHAGDLLEDLGYDRAGARPAAPAAARTVPNLIRLHQLRVHHGAEAVAASAGKSVGGPRRRGAVRPLGMASTSYPLRRLRRPGRTAPSATSTSTASTSRATCAMRTPQAPAGGASSSVNDMTRWLAMVLANGSYEGKQIVDAKASAAGGHPTDRVEPRDRARDAAGFYGYGFNVGATSAARMELSHSGGFELGAGTNIVILPSADVAIVALTNATPAGVPESLTAEFADLVQFGEVREDWYKLYGTSSRRWASRRARWSDRSRRPVPRPSAPLASYVGTYNNDYWGPARITEKTASYSSPSARNWMCPWTIGTATSSPTLGSLKTPRRERFPRRRSTETG